MKKNFNTLNEQMLRMKSLFTEERLYGNLIKEQGPEDEGNNLKNQGYGDKLPEGRKEEDFDVEVDSEGKKWYKEKEEVKLKREKEAEKLKKQQAKEAFEKWRKENVPEEEGWLEATHDGSHKKDTKNYVYKTYEPNGTEFYKPEEKGNLTDKDQRFGQCKKVLRKLYGDFKKLDFGNETEFIKNIATDDNKDKDDNRVKQIQYCIKHNGKKLKKFPKFNGLITSFEKVYPNGYVEPAVTNDDKNKKNKDKTPKKYRIDSTTYLKPKGKREFSLYGIKGAEVAYEENDKWIIDPVIKKRAINKIKEITGVSSVDDITILKGKPEGVLFQISASK